MHLDVAGPSFIEGVDGQSIMFVLVGAIILVCIISIIVYKKIKGRKIKNEKD